MIFATISTMEICQEYVLEIFENMLSYLKPQDAMELMRVLEFTLNSVADAYGEELRDDQLLVWAIIVEALLAERPLGVENMIL